MSTDSNTITHQATSTFKTTIAAVLDGNNSTVHSSIKTFSAADYVVFGSVFVLSSLIGVFFAIKDRKKTDDAEGYLLGNRKMSGWPVALSLTASFMSAITVMGTPAEIYLYGTMFLWFFVAYTWTVIVTAEIFTPVFYNLGISSIYEYLEMRFSRSVRMAGTGVFTLQTIVYMGMVMYMPALALNKVTGLSLIFSICGTAIVCTFYTTIGGLKAVIWTDVIQCFVMWGGFAAIIIEGCIHVGGIEEVLRIAYEGGRIEFLRFDIDPRIRHSFFSVAIGGGFMWLSVYATNQSMVQRYLSCRTLKQAKLALYINNIGLFIIVVLAAFTGVTMYAVYHDCDPLATGRVEKSDQLTPYLVMDILEQYPGIAGLFVASAYSGTLSTVSTGINALACTTVEDFVKVIKPTVSDKTCLVLSKLFVIFYGMLGLGVAFLVSLLDRILTVALKMFGIIGGPLLGVFCLGLFTTRGNSAGALGGLFGSLSLGFWLAVGSYTYPPTVEFTRRLETSTENCTFSYANDTSEVLIQNSTAIRPVIADAFYSLSYCHYSTLLVLTSWFLGYIISLATNRCRHEQPLINSNLIAFSSWFCCKKFYDSDTAYVAGKEKPLK